VTSVLIGVLVVSSSWRLLAESVSVLLESAPRGIDVDEVRSVMRSVPGVRAVHDLHLWSITSGMHALSAHVIAGGSESRAALLSRLRSAIHERFGIEHVTIQIEPPDFEERTGHA
jgi:cobalt-zinc-cadmium efflux system protein